MTTSLDTTVLTPRVVAEIKGVFWVPAYQRGYRWGPEEVMRLLDDIDAAGTRPYYLQPIVVKAIGEDHWELVDGQQRLTTLYLILRVIQEMNLPVAIRYRLEYETRPESAAFLDSLDATRRDENIDFFHIVGALEAIERWLDAKPDRLRAAIKLYQALAEEDRVTIIWYEAPEDVDGPSLFTRLNVGRIPLTDAELVKASVLASTKTRTPGREREVAAQWDSIERDLRAPSAWAFISGKEASEPSHVALLLDALANTVPSRDTPLYHTFETLRPRIEADPKEFWEQVVDVHSNIMGWYEDQELYHHIGYLVNRERPTTLRELMNLYSGASKTEFKEALKHRITEGLKLSANELVDLNYRSSKTGDALLLMNIATVLRNPHSAERYPFDSHTRDAWSIEHIHAQQAETLNTEAQWREWLRLNLDGLTALPGVDADALQRVRNAVPPPLPSGAAPTQRSGLTRGVFEELQHQIRDLYQAAGQESLDDVDSIDNLALLSRRANSALSNSIFEAKRQAIIEFDRAGTFIPVCTRNVFLKYYTNANGQQVHFWGPADRSGYVTAMTQVLQPYLTTESDDE